MHSLILLAKQAVESYIKKGEIISPFKTLPKEFLERKAGTFVTIEKKLRGLPRSEPKPRSRALRSHCGAKVLLRGCVGTYLPTKENIAQEIIHDAIAAATEDYRFTPIDEEELPFLSYTAYVLSRPELVKDIQELDPKKFGVIVKTTPLAYSKAEDVVFNGHFVPKSALLLPALPGIDTVEKQISAACQKAGINPSQEKIIIYQFTTEKYQ